MAAQILELFPLSPIEPSPSVLDDTATQSLKLQTIHESLIIKKDWPEAADAEQEHVKRPGELYKRYRKIEELPVTAKAFYELACRSPLVTYHTDRVANFELG